MPLKVTLADGRAADPQVAITPVFVQVEPGLLMVVGTGFYVTRYGLFLTAKHVVDELAEQDKKSKPALTWNWRANGHLYFRPILTCTFDAKAPRDASDIAICQTVDNVSAAGVVVRNQNERISLISAASPLDAHVGTYAFPGNASLEFRDKSQPTRIFADVFEGRVLAHIGPGERFLRYPHVETSIAIRSGASGGPVFAEHGHAWAVNCRGWDFDTASAEAPLSSVVPVASILDLQMPFPHIPTASYEYGTVPATRRGSKVSLRELAAWGHVSVDPPVPPNLALQRTGSP